jgi:uncharacterized OB-fold protein
LKVDVTRRPLPRPTPVSAPFWDGLRQREIRLQRCDDCRRVQFYPRPACRFCGALELTWETLSGGAELYSYTVVHRAPFEAFADAVPYALAIVALDEGPRLVSTVETSDLDALRIGMRLKPLYDDVSDELTLLRFEPA